MIIVNLIDKQRLLSEGGGGFSSSDSVAWKARLFLFLGFALMAGGLAGSIVSFYPPNFVSLQAKLTIACGFPSFSCTDRPHYQIRATQLL